MRKFLTIAHLRKKTGIKLVSSAIPTFANSKKTYAALEKETESKTHREMREHAIAHFERLGYQIYPSGIGVEGTFTLADLLAFRDGRVIFVECLTDAKATTQDIERKMQLRQFGEVCFVVFGGHGCRWENDNRKMPQVFETLALETDVLKYHSGHWQNGFEKRIAHLTKFPKISFNVGRSEQIRLSVTIKLMAKTAELYFEFKTMPYQHKDGLEFLLDIARRLAWRVFHLRKFVTPAKFNMRSPSGKIFKDKNGKLVAQICVKNGTGFLKVRGRDGLKVLEYFLNELQKSDLDVEIDQTMLAETRQKLGMIVERKGI